MSETANRPTTRRAMLGSAAGFTVLAGIAAAAIAKPDNLSGTPPALRGDDAAMLALCERFLQLEAQVAATYDRERALHDTLEVRGASHEELRALEKRGDLEREPWHDEQRALLADLSEMSAVTLEGQRARARVLMTWYNMRQDGAAHVGMDGEDILPLFRDLLGEAV